MYEDESSSEAGKELSRLGAAKGGEARAKKLSPERRREIARAAVEARWAKAGKTPLPKATHTGVLKFGDLEFECAVLENGERVISETAFMKAMGMYRSGALSVRRHEEPGAQVPLSLAFKNLKPFIIQHLGGVHFKPTSYVTTKGSIVTSGITAAILPKVCEVWIDAEKAGILGQRQKVIAAKADILLRGMAHVGIVALVDEATGYQDARAKDALAKILEQFIAKELRPYVSTFRIGFYKEMFRLRKWNWPDLPAEQRKRPVLVGKITNDIVYDRLAPGVRSELHRVTPRDEKGRLKHKLFRRLTDDVGHPRLEEHLATVTGLMRAADTWQEFMRLLNRSLPRYGDTPYLPFEG